MKYPDAVFQSNSQLAQEPEITKHLDQEGVFRGTDEGLNLQVLLGETEEKDLILQAFFVDIGDGLARQSEVVGEKHINFSGFGPRYPMRRKGTGHS